MRDRHGLGPEAPLSPKGGVVLVWCAKLEVADFRYRSIVEAFLRPGHLPDPVSRLVFCSSSILQLSRRLYGLRI